MNLFIGAFVGALSAIVGLWAGRPDGQPYPSRTILVNVLLASSFIAPVLWGLIEGDFGLSGLWFVALLVALSVSDFFYLIIPDRIVLPGIALLFATVPLSFSYKMTGLLAGAILVVVIILLSGGKMGGGDIRLNALIGLILGWKMMFLSFFVASVLGVIVEGSRRFRDNQVQEIPFGPYLSVAAVLTVVWGEGIWNQYVMLWN